jgi:phage baseplate assembly protein W
MAVTVRRTPTQEVWSDLDPRFITDSQGNVKKVTNVDSVIGSMDNIVGTFLGERVMLPQFASKVKSMLFEPINQDMMGFLATEVKNVIETWDDRVRVIAVNTNADPDNNIVNMSIEFSIKSYQGVFTYNTVIK